MSDVEEVKALLDEIEALKAENATLEQQLGQTGGAKVVVATSGDGIPTAADAGGSTLVYWNICGLAQPVRYALELAGIPYKDVRIDAGKATDADYKQVWMGKKPEVNKHVAFANLPYFLQGDVKLAQSNAILSFIGRKYGLLGDDPVAVDLVLNEASDLDGAVTGRCYGRNGGMESMSEFFADTLRTKLQNWSDFLGAKPFMAGSSVSVADCKIYELFRKILLIEKEGKVTKPAMPDFPKLTAYVARMEALPALKSYQASGSFLPRPLNNPHSVYN